MKKVVVVLFSVLIVAFGSVSAQEREPGPPDQEGMPQRGKPDMFRELKLTDEQKEKMKDLKFETEKKQIELRSKLEVSRLELGRLLFSDTPDKPAIEKKMNEVTANETALKMNKLNGWFEANKNLTPEQQKAWREVLRREVMGAAARERRGIMRRPAHQ